MKVMIVSPKNKTLFNFRGDLIKEMIARGHEVIAVGPNQDGIEQILALGAKLIELPLVKDNTSIKGDFQYYKGLKKIMQKQQPDLVFSYTIKPVIYGSLAAKKTKIKEIYPMITGLGRVYGANTLKARVLKRVVGILYKKAFKAANRVIFQNEEDLKHFTHLGYLPIEKGIRVDGSGVNMQVFSKVALPSEPVFLMIARIIKEKGVLEYAKAARIVKKKYAKARFVLIGGYDHSMGAIKEEELAPYIEEGSIEFVGETKNVVPYLEKARVFVLPTYYKEGLPRTILEAMAMGRAVITTDWAGCRDAVRDGENGCLIPPRSSICLADKMEWFIKNPDRVVQMGEEGFRLCQQKYEVRKVNEHMLHIMGIEDIRERKAV